MILTKSGLWTPSQSVVFTTLPNAGPFAASGTVNISGLTNLTISANQNAPYSDQTAPLMYDTLTINSAKQWIANYANGNNAIYLWVNKLVFNGELVGSGTDAGQANAPNGADGGSGASGGVGGGGAPGSCGCGTGFPGSSGDTEWVAPSYAFPNGGSTGATCGGPGPGFGEGGSGSAGGQDGNPFSSGGGGGGGAGLICIVCNTLTGSATSKLSSNGGAASLDSDGNVFSQSGGAGGVIWVAARTYNGLILPARVSVAGGGLGAGDGNSSIRQISPTMVLTTKAFNQSWAA